MNYITFSVTIGFMIFGYLIGSLSMAIIVTKIFKLGDIRNEGSGNAGATNILRSYGPKYAALVFVLDAMKTIVAMLIASSVKDHVILPAVGIAVIIGHSYPIFFDFEGGKGAACLCGLFFGINWPVAIIGAFVFFAIVRYWKMVSMGSLISPIIIIILLAILLGLNTVFADAWAAPLTSEEDWFVPIICLIAAHAIVIYRHKENIIRISRGYERKLHFK